MSVKVNYNFDPSKIIKEIKEMGSGSLKAFADAVLAGAYLIKGDVTDFIARGAKSGIVYRINSSGNRKKGKKKKKTKRRKILHQSSAPGESPANQYGRLLGSVKLIQKTYIKFEVGSELKYAEYLEEGTPKGQMEARPYLAPALEKNQSEIDKLIKKALRPVVEK